MAISLISTPPLVAHTGNPVRFRLQSDNQYSSAGEKYEFNIHFGNAANTGDTITLAWGSHSQTFTAAADPDDSGLQISDHSQIANLNDWVALVATQLAANYYINHDFILTSDGFDLFLTARNFGFEYSMSMTVVWTNGYNPVGTSTGSAPVSRDFYRLGLQVMLQSGSSWINCGEDILPVDDQGLADFDIHMLFADRVKSEFKFPEATDQIMIHRPNGCVEYRVKYFEQYGNPVMARKLTESDSFYVLSGGVSSLQQAIYNRQGSNFWAKLDYNQYFLTWQPKEKFVDRWTTEKLYYLVRSSLESIKLKIEINYNDGTPSETITKTTIANPVKYGVYEIVVSLNVLQLNGYDSNIIANYRVWIENSSNERISEIRKFVIDYQPYEDTPRQFLFLNSLGGYDTLRITGIVEDKFEYQRVSITKVLGVGFTDADHQTLAMSITESRKYKANTGWVFKDDLAWIRDFFLSKQVYQMAYGKLVPIEILTTEANGRVDREDLFSIDFEYRVAYQNGFYSPEIIPTELTDDFNDDYVNR